MRVLLVGEGEAVEAVRLGLAQREDLAEVAFDEDEGLDLAKRYGFDVVIVFAGGPEGIEAPRLIREMRSAGVTTPVMAVMDWATNDAPTRVAAFEAGADDVVGPAFRREEFEARVLALGRRGRGHASPVIEVGGISIDLAARVVKVAGRHVHLTGREFALVEALALHKGHVVSKERLMDRLYDGLDDPEAKIIDVYVCKIRRKLEMAGAVGVVRTVWGQGYMLPTAASADVGRTPVPLDERPRGRPTIPQRILRLLAGGPQDFEMIRSALQAERNSVRGALFALIQSGQVRNAGGARPGQAIYTLAQAVAA